MSEPTEATKETAVEVAEHTSLPWHMTIYEGTVSEKARWPCGIYNGDSTLVADFDDVAPDDISRDMCLANARLIVTACNSHYELLEALKAMQLTAIWLLENQPGETVPDWVSDTIQTAYDDESARAAISNATPSGASE